MNLTFELLSQCEPRLIDLEDQCRKVRKSKNKSWEREQIWYHDLKHQMLKLIGFMRNPGPGNIECQLYSSEAYNVVYSHLIKVLEI
jgi:hypothetical protein